MSHTRKIISLKLKHKNDKCGNVSKRENDTYLSFVVVVDVVVIFRLIRIQQLVYPLTLSFIQDYDVI